MLGGWPEVVALVLVSVPCRCEVVQLRWSVSLQPKNACSVAASKQRLQQLRR